MESGWMGVLLGEGARLASRIGKAGAYESESSVLSMRSPGTEMML